MFVPEEHVVAKFMFAYQARVSKGVSPPQTLKETARGALRAAPLRIPVRDVRKRQLYCP